MAWHPLQNLAADIALGVIINNASRAAQVVQPATDGTTGPILNDALTFVGVLTGLKTAGQSSNNILSMITTIVDLIKVYGPEVALIVAAVLKLIAGG